MPDGNLQPKSNDPLENYQWQEKQWAEEMAYAKATVARQKEEAELTEAAAKEKAEAKQQAAEAQEGQGADEDDWASRLAIAKNSERAGASRGEGSDERRIEDHPELKKKADLISKKIKEEKKKTGTGYMLTYILLTFLGAILDIIGFILDITGGLAWINLIIGPIYAAMRFLGIRYANLGMTSKEHEKMNLQITLISGAISSLGLPSRTISMIIEFGARRKIANDASKEMKKLQKERDKLLGPDLARQYIPGK